MEELLEVLYKCINTEKFKELTNYELVIGSIVEENYYMLTLKSLSNKEEFHFINIDGTNLK